MVYYSQVPDVGTWDYTILKHVGDAGLGETEISFGCSKSHRTVET